MSTEKILQNIDYKGYTMQRVLQIAKLRLPEINKDALLWAINFYDSTRSREHTIPKLSKNTDTAEFADKAEYLNTYLDTDTAEFAELAENINKEHIATFTEFYYGLSVIMDKIVNRPLITLPLSHISRYLYIEDTIQRACDLPVIVIDGFIYCPSVNITKLRTELGSYAESLDDLKLFYSLINESVNKNRLG